MNLRKMSKFIEYVPTFSENPIKLLDDIVKRAQKYLPEHQIPKIYEAYYFAKKAHEWVLRLSGEPYIVHPVKATAFLMDIKPDIASIQACLLHDVIEDTPITYDDIKKEFGEEIANLCEGLEKVSKIKYKWEDRHLETLKKTFIAMAKDLRVIFIKIADRIHNIQTLNYHPKEKKRYKIAEETMKIYVPIARKLWLYNFQLYLENGSFKVLHEKEFNKIFIHLKKYFGSEKKYKDKWVKILSSALKKEWIENFTIEGRLKSPRRIYQKMVNKYQSSDISNIMDLLAYRIITDSVANCYIIFGIIHKYYTPLIKKIKDYIAMPKFNWYKSIHTTVLGIFRFPTEIQIRTKEMDEIAKYWVAAHFEYSEKWYSTSVKENQSKRIKKVQQLVGKYKNSDEKENFKTKLNIEVLEKSTFLYTPAWDVLELPLKSTVLDFAFRIHSKIWLKYKNAMVNWEIKPISFIPTTGDIIEIKTFKNKYSANRHRLEFLHTPSAKVQLNRFLKIKKREDFIEKAKIWLNKRLNEFNLPMLNSEQDKIKNKYKSNELEQIFLEILDKKKNYSQLIKSVYPKKRKAHLDSIPKTSKNKSSWKPSQKIIVDLDKRIDYTLCLECKPKPPQKIISRTWKNGIKIHTLRCKALKTLSFAKLLEAHREGQEAETYKLQIELETTHKYGNIINIMTLFSELNITITQISIQNIDKTRNKVSLEAEFENPTKIAFLLNDLKKYKNSIKVLKKKFINK